MAAASIPAAVLSLIPLNRPELAAVARLRRVESVEPEGGPPPSVVIMVDPLAGRCGVEEVPPVTSADLTDVAPRLEFEGGADATVGNVAGWRCGDKVPRMGSSAIEAPAASCNAAGDAAALRFGTSLGSCEGFGNVAGP